MVRFLSFTSFALLLIFASCQKEKSFELGKISKGSLQSSSGDCLPKLVAGIYKAGQVLTDSNYIEVTVDVTETGRYSIETDTLNGYYFKGSGNFSTVGPATVKLRGFGTPGSAATDDFAVFYDSSLCIISVTVTGGGGSGGTAVYSLQGNGGSCITSNAVGTYTQGVALTSANKIDIQVNVTTVGTWNIATTSVAGFLFAGAGNFTTTGVQTITLTAAGTPTASGAQIFPVTAGTSSCSFTVTVAPGTTTPNTDHFPLTANSFWTYNDAFSTTPTDTIKRINNSTATHNANSYRVITENDNAGSPQWEYHIRKVGNDYFEYTSVHDYAIMTFDDPVPEADILFLKEGITNGQTWLSAEYSGKEGGVNKKLRYSFSAQVLPTFVVSGKTFSDVYKITWKPQVSTNGGAFADEGLVWESYYAKGVGLIDMKGTAGTTSIEYKIRFYQVF